MIKKIQNCGHLPIVNYKRTSFDDIGNKKILSHFTSLAYFTLHDKKRGVAVRFGLERVGLSHFVAA